MKNVIKIFYVISFIALMGLAIPSYAEKKDDNLFPGGCVPVGYSFKYKVLTLHPNLVGRSQSIYFIHNKSMSTTVKFYQMRTGDEPYVMYLNNKIKPNQWGVFATDEKQVKFICTSPTKTSKYGKIIDCAKVLALCEYPNVKFSINNHGNYWSVDSNTKYGARSAVIRQGVLLKW